MTVRGTGLRASLRALTLISAAVGPGGLAVIGCGPGPAPSASAAASPSPSASASAVLPSLATSAVPGAAVEVDPSLLDILPADIDGVPIEPDPETADRLAADPSLAREVEALALALAVDADAGGEDLAIVNVVRVRSLPIEEGFFREWRDSYDEAACASAGGMAGNAEVEMGGRRVFIGSCAGGAFTYHTIHEDDLIVSITSVGARRLGEAIIADLAG